MAGRGRLNFRARRAAPLGVKYGQHPTLLRRLSILRGRTIVNPGREVFDPLQYPEMEKGDYCNARDQYGCSYQRY
ncbi:hypothetical protein SAMN05444050_6712 [Afipia sp. GAS231]|nr:hypothetical protein SAMN05444050_6712 [Afipia sp. GAS231]